MDQYNRNDIVSGYIPVKKCVNGLFSIFSVLFFHNFSLETVSLGNVLFNKYDMKTHFCSRFI